MGALLIFTFLTYFTININVAEINGVKTSGIGFAPLYLVVNAIDLCLIASKCRPARPPFGVYMSVAFLGLASVDYIGIKNNFILGGTVGAAGLYDGLVTSWLPYFLFACFLWLIRDSKNSGYWTRENIWKKLKWNYRICICCADQESREHQEGAKTTVQK